MFTIPTGVTAISFDIWKTLIKGNKAFTRPRLKLIFDNLGYPNIDVELLRTAYLLADKFYNDKAEEDQVDYSMAERLGMMFAYVGIDAEVPDAETISAIQAKTGELRLQPQFMPSFIEPDLPHTLAMLQDHGFVLGLLSNTGMDDRQVMEPILIQLGLWDMFQAHVFSSDDGRAKPNPGLFRLTAAMLRAAPHEVLHVGDNTNADYRAIQAGLHAVVYAPTGSEYPHITSMRQLL